MMVPVVGTKLNYIMEVNMYTVKFTLFGVQKDETLKELEKVYLVVKDSFVGKDNKVVICYRCCVEEEEE